MKRASSVLLAVALVIPALFVCTEAYAADKAVSYRGNTYNVANVTKTSSRVDGEAKDSQIAGLRSTSKQQFEKYIEQYEEIIVTTVILFDDDQMVYQTARVKKYNDLQKQIKKLDSAMTEIAKFMGRKKGGLLKLK